MVANPPRNHGKSIGLHLNGNIMTTPVVPAVPCVRNAYAFAALTTTGEVLLGLKGGGQSFLVLEIYEIINVLSVDICSEVVDFLLIV